MYRGHRIISGFMSYFFLSYLTILLSYILIMVLTLFLSHFFFCCFFKNHSVILFVTQIFKPLHVHFRSDKFKNESSYKLNWSSAQTLSYSVANMLRLLSNRAIVTVSHLHCGFYVFPVCHLTSIFAVLFLSLNLDHCHRHSISCGGAFSTLGGGGGWVIKL